MPDTFQWSVSKRVYTWKSNGRVVTQSRLRDWVAELVTNTRGELRKIGERLIAGEINRAQWALDVGQTLRNEHRALAMLSAGGRDQMTNSLWSSLGGRLQGELRFFNSFASQIDNTELDTLGARFLNRLESYADSARFTYERSVRARETAVGGQQERNVLGGSANSCGGCIEASDQEWVEAGTLSEPGDRECGPGCNCTIEFREASAVNQEQDSEAA